MDANYIDPGRVVHELICFLEPAGDRRVAWVHTEPRLDQDEQPPDLHNPDSFRNLVTANPKGRELYHQVERGELSQPDFERQMAQLLGVQPTGLIQGLLADLRPEPLIAEAVARARTARIRVGVITNSWGTAPYDPYAAYQLHQRFDAVVISSQVGLRKPEPAIYRLAADELAVHLERIVFVDDIAANLQPAKELGMAVIHHVDPGRTVRNLERLLGLSDRLLRRP